MRQEGTKNIFKINGLNTDAALLAQIDVIQKTLALWNKKINISKNDTGDRFLCENVLDPIVSCQNHLKFGENYLTKYQNEQKTLHLIDLGCGGGFVGIFWTIWLSNIYPTLSIKTTLFDAQRKRINFCAELVRQLKLGDKISCVQGRAEEPPAGFLQAFDLVVSRATWDFATFVKMAMPFAKESGRLISFEGPSGLDAMKKAGATVLEYKVLPTVHPRFLGAIQIFFKL